MARTRGAVRRKAVTTPGDEGSVGFHRSLGFAVRLEEEDNGPGQPRVVFTRELVR
ncbi:hypothetical protein [Streptomyces sp. NPDC088766]|uniref:hypothetical protein n=1 Tax=Streptomyces sp. NPDC088766 TaxID=3365893 RepID=UPI0037FDC04E